ncbi:endonuclease MutS2 [Streptococcus sp. DD12]|uniref:endonuclease MutS2 n=1 Tax=Streptococcus sp. DD12 TaxID=1777880 RepID=UPI00079B1964|nr:endonuclease MutS2 [Streptococcus sp. DD12]KXT75683.1 Recombination inhibitory protein MutS2 [Streptococcus sp. DD12]
MNEKVLSLLEFDQVKEKFRPYLTTQMGEEELGQLVPLTDAQKIQDQWAQVADFAQMESVQHHLDLGRLDRVSEPLKRVELQADLSLADLLAIKRLVSESQKVRDFYQGLDNVSLSALDQLFEKMESYPQLTGAFLAVNEAGFLENFASPELESIRRQIQRDEQAIRQVLQSIVKDKGDMLTEQLVADRNGRSVLPVKNTYRNRIKGIVHDISASGNTVYIEPREVVALSESITQSRAAERHEIRRILRGFSDLLRPQVQSLANTAWLLGHLDLVRAKYRFLRDYGASLPTFSPDGGVRLLHVVHPLLEKPVANDLLFDAEMQSILITGPNTGGKTLLLKTLGLAQIMAQSGLPICADTGSQVTLFTEIFADIGDEQSIEQSLSTFSSHMTAIVSIIERADAHSLVLLDELGAGTDPQEGAALAIAILENLREKGARTVATTHYPELKAYGIETPGVVNASMSFDMESLQPTYHFMQGVPGRSNAFDIAQRLGLSSTIVETAQGLVDVSNDVNRIIERLEAQSEETARRLDTIRDLEQENYKYNRALKKLYNDFNHAKDKEVEEATKEARQIVDKALEKSDAILKDLDHRAQLKPHQVIEAKGALKKLVPEPDLSKNKVLKKAKKVKAAKVGDEITVTAYGQRGTLTNQLKDGRWEAQVGLIKMTLKADEFTLNRKDKSSERSGGQTAGGRRVKRQKTQKASARLDLRGQRYEAAMAMLDDFIDQALLNNLAQVDIIHGIGTGVIREGVQNYLSRSKHVKNYAYAPQNAGGSGVTVVTFKG